MRIGIVTATVLILAGSIFAQATKPATAQTAVPVKQVVLFSSGVGYFEHFGSVAGDGSTELRFKTQQINDILKSLVLQDLDGGKVSTITYPSQDPISKTLKSFQVDITNNPALGDLLNQLRGAKVTVKQGAETTSGTILGVEKKKRPVGPTEKPEVIEVAVLNLITTGKLVAIELEKIDSIAFDDAALQDELNRALAALTQARDQDKKPVTINFNGQGDRRIRIGYVVETPVWKTSYRLILATGDAKPKLQGWAIVENQTDNDWDNVQLSLVSGRPISFVQDLYQPLYVPRPVVQPELYASLRPQTYDAGIDAAKKAEVFADAPAAAGLIAGSGRGGGPKQQQQAQRTRSLESVAGAPATPPPAMDATASVSSVASAAKIGELFEYTVGNVSLPRQKSAMIPIITDDIEVEKVSIYNASVLPKNPLNGARVKNTTGKHLLAGPVTVLEASSYAGDAQIDNVPPDQERLLSYGIDLQMRIDATKNKQESALLTAKIVKGVLEMSYKDIATQEYLADNKGDAAKTLIVEHPLHQGWKLVDSEKPIETTELLYRFKGKVDAGKASKLIVKEEFVRGQTLAILDGDIPTLFHLSKQGGIPEDVRSALTQAVALKQKLVDSERQIEERRKTLAEITAEQTRIRENLKTVQQNTPYYNRLTTKLNDQETKIEKLQTEIEDLTETMQGQRKDLENYLSKLDVG